MPGTAVKVHVVLQRDVVKDPARRREALAAIVDRSGIHDINEKRLERFGIVSGMVDADRINALRGMEQVRSVSMDEERHAV
jgi:hypothetical protein